MLGPDGVYMINIIDAYESDARAEEKAERKIKKEKITDRAAEGNGSGARSWPRPDSYGGFLGAWVKTAKKTFPHVVHLRHRRHARRRPARDVRRRRLEAAARPRRPRQPRRRPEVLPGRQAASSRGPSRPSTRRRRPPLAGHRPDRRLRPRREPARPRRRDPRRRTETRESLTDDRGHRSYAVVGLCTEDWRQSYPLGTLSFSSCAGPGITLQDGSLLNIQASPTT